jgi:hypothetical protein
MPFEKKTPFKHKPGLWTAFLNESRSSDSAPHFKGSGTLPDGTPVWISIWKETGKDGKTRVSGSIEVKDASKASSKSPRSFNDSITDL